MTSKGGMIRGRDRPISISVVSGNAAFLDALKAVLGHADDLWCVGVFAGLEPIPSEMCERKPDVLVIDRDWLPFGRVECLSRFRETVPSARALLVSLLGEGGQVAAGLASGADGYLLKREGLAGLTHAVRRIARDGWFLCESSGASLIYWLRAIVLPIAGANPCASAERVEFFELVRAIRGCGLEDLCVRALQEAGFSVERLAELCGLSLRRFEAEFRHQTGRTAHEAFHEVRMRMAREYLRLPGVRIKEFASILGYRHSHDFARAFKAYYGTTPSGLRREEA